MNQIFQENDTNGITQQRTRSTSDGQHMDSVNFRQSHKVLSQYQDSETNGFDFKVTVLHK